MPRLQNENTTNNAGSRINTGRKKIGSALDVITAVKVDMLALKAQVNASIAAADGVFSALDLAELNTVLAEFKSNVTGFAGNL